MNVPKPRWQAATAIATVLCLVATMSSVALAKPKASDPSLRGSWSLNEGTGTVAKDRSSYKNHGTITDATWVAGRTGNALHFDGAYDYVRVPASATLEPRHVSLALWFRATPYTDYHWDWKVLAYKGLINCWASSYSLKSANDAQNGMVFMIYSRDPRDGILKNIYTPPVAGVWDGKWHHAVGTFDGSMLRLYIDGQLASSHPWTGSISYDTMTDHQDFVIGDPTYMCQQKNYRGDIDEVLVWDRALSAEEAAKLAAPTGKKKRRK